MLSASASALLIATIFCASAVSPAATRFRLFALISFIEFFTTGAGATSTIRAEWIR